MTDIKGLKYVILLLCIIVLTINIITKFSTEITIGSSIAAISIIVMICYEQFKQRRNKD